ncbi:MAG: cellulase family glycosylhydrolase [Pseudomonadota bacterium]
MPEFTAATASLDVTVRSSWADGLVADLSLTPEQALNGWQIEFDYAGDIVNIWNARILSRSGDRYLVEAMDYNSGVAAGMTTVFGFQGSGSAQAITPVSINGASFGEGDGGPPPTPDPMPDPMPDPTPDPDPGPDPTPEPGPMPSPDPTPAPGGGLIIDGPLTTAGNQILDATGAPVQIRAVNWFGAENDVRAPHGLWQRPMTEMMDQMVAEGFNAIRLPFSVENILDNQPATSVQGDPSLAGLTTLEIFDRIVAYAEEIGIKIILDAHRITQGNGAEGIWYAGGFDEDDWIDAWQLLANRYGDSPAVIGADLLNEPHLGTWGTGQRNDWAAAAELAGNAVLDVAPDWLIVVEGIGTYQGDNYWWGGQLQGVRDRPVELAVDNKLVYSPHDYPASIFPQPWFTDGSNLYDVFRENWGFIYEEEIAPVLLGEFGSRLENPLDLAWAEAITSYLAGDFDGDGVSDLAPGAAGPSFAWWSWNPNSGDTGGYLLDDWTTVRPEAADLLEPLLAAEPAADSGAGDDAGHDHGAGDGADQDAGHGAGHGADHGSDHDHHHGNDHGDHHGDHQGGHHGGDLTNPIGGTPHDHPRMPGDTRPPSEPVQQTSFVDIHSFGNFHGSSSHTMHDQLDGGRTPITTEALDAYNGLRSFLGLPSVELEAIGQWAFDNDLTNNDQAYGNDLMGVGLFYAMQGAKVGWIDDAAFDPQILADVQRTARLGDPGDVMAMVEAHGHAGLAAFLEQTGLDDSFINTLKMEPHYGGWMHGRTHGDMVFPGEGGAALARAHDVNHLTVLSHDQTMPFMNDTFDWPQWPALEVPHPDVIDYFQSMVILGDPLGDALPAGTTMAGPVAQTLANPIAPADLLPGGLGDAAGDQADAIEHATEIGVAAPETDALDLNPFEPVF